MILINYIYLKANWTHPFEEKYVHQRKCKNIKMVK